MEAVKVTEAERRAQIKVQEAEIQRYQLELQATKLNAAEAEHDRLIMESEGQAKAIKARGIAEAEVVRARGQAEAMKLKAGAYNEYNQAAVLDKLLTNMPEMVRAIAEPLSKVDKVTIVYTGNSDSSGNGNSIGASRLTGDIVNMAAQIPVLFELLSGTNISTLMNRIPALSSKDGPSTNGTQANTSGEQASGQ